MRLISLLIAAALLPATPAVAQTRTTTCNVRYNNQGIIAADVPCDATFSAGRLTRVRYRYTNGRWYDWSTLSPSVTPDSRWPECVRYTHHTGNQWQVCTVPSPDQLGIR